MSFLHSHSEIGSIVKLPTQSFSETVPFVSVSSVLTASRAVPANKVIFITVGGVATGTVSSITVTPGFTEIFVLSSRLAKIFWKLTGASEPSQYSINFVGGGVLGGHYRLLQMDAETIGAPPEVTVNELGSSYAAGTPGNLMNLTDAPYNVLFPSLALAAGNVPASQTGIEVNNGFGPASTGQSGSFKAWNRTYSAAAMAELTSAYHPTNSSIVSGRMTVITGKRMF
jgi:hypothetical protein